MRNSTTAGVVVGLLFALSRPTFAEENWSYWRGPNFSSISGEKNLPDNWDPKGGEGSNVIWSEEIPTRSTPTIMNGRLYVLTTANPDNEKEMGEKVVCMDAETGSTLWEHEFNVYLSDVPAERVGWSSVVGDPETGLVYAQGVCGYFCCLDGETGKPAWEKSLHEEFGFLSTYGGRTNFPLIFEDNVIVSAVVIGWGEMSKPAHRFIAFDKRTGVPIWFNGTSLLPEDTTYSAPVLAVIDGQMQMVFSSGDGGVHGMQPRTGKLLWSYFVSARGMNVSPLVVGDRVYCGHSEENLDTTEMGALFCIDPTKDGPALRSGAKDITETGEVWRITGKFIGRSSPMLIEGRLYAADDRGSLFCFNPDTGEQIGDITKMGTMMRANLLYADGKIYANEVSRGAYIFKPTEDGVEKISQVRYQRGEEAHGSPIAHNGKIYIPTTGNMYCIGLPDAEVSVEELPGIGTELVEVAPGTPALAQLVPCELLHRPGFRQIYHVRLYNSRGQFIHNASGAEVAFSVSGPGTIDATGKYTVSRDENAHAAAMINAEVGELKATARVRIVPELNWSFDFDNGTIPVTWVGARYRHVPLDFDLLMKLKAEDQLAGDLYLFLTTEFVNAPPPPGHTTGVFDDTTPYQRLNGLLQFVDLADGPDRPFSADQANATLGPALQKLIDEKVLASAEWTGENASELRLTVTKGDRKFDGNGVMCKITTIPKGSRSQGWMGLPDLHDYTIQSDVYAFARNGKLPDIGLIGQRYTLDLMGASQQLQIRTWTPQLNRLSFNTPVEWQADQWYTIKFQTSVKDGRAILRGKVWKKGEAEPEAWTVEGADAFPNEVGSPGLFGNADSEIFYDNLTVTRNKL